MKTKIMSFFMAYAMALSLGISASAETAGTAAAGDAVAETGGQKYSTLQAAINAAADGATVTLLADVEVNKILVTDSNVVIDLDSHDLSTTASYLVSLTSDDSIEFKNGNIECEYCAFYCNNGYLKLTDVNIKVKGDGIDLYNAAEAYIDAESTFESTGEIYSGYCVAIMSIDNPNVTPKLTSYGTLVSNRDAATITGNGLDKSNPDINILGGSVTNKVGSAMYLPQPGTVTIKNATIDGQGAGIALKSGDLDIENSNVIAHSDETLATDENSASNGIAVDGSAIMIDSCSGYVGEININISGNSRIESDHAYAIHEIGNIEEKTNILSLNISGGQFNSSSEWKKNICVRDASVENVNICGGKFSMDIDPEFLADGCGVGVIDNYYVVISAKAPASAPGTYKTAVTGGTYDQATLFEKSFTNATQLSDIGFKIKLGDSSEITHNYENTATIAEGTVMFGLIITDIPENETVTVAIN